MDAGGEEDQRFRKSLAASLLSSLLFALLVPLIDLSLQTLEEEVEVPERVVRLMMEARPLPPPPDAGETRPEPRPSDESLVQEAPTQTAKPKEGPGIGAGRGTRAREFSPSARSSPASRQNQTIARLGSQAHLHRGCGA